MILADINSTLVTLDQAAMTLAPILAGLIMSNLGESCKSFGATISDPFILKYLLYINDYLQVL